ncbi:MAG: DNA-binding protein [Acidobacteria bacterium]|nr:DNA-binding protein [Acidobacteriota bacterium]
MDAGQTHDHTTPILLDTAGAARRIDARLSPRTMERWRRSGYGPRYVLIGRRVGYTDDAIREWLQQQERQHTRQTPVQRDARQRAGA